VSNEFEDLGEIEFPDRESAPRRRPASPPPREPDPVPFEIEEEAEDQDEAGPGAEPPPRRGPRSSFLRNETLRRVLFAIPLIAFAITIVAVGGALFAAAMLVMALLGLREYFAMTAEARPLPLAAYITAAGMIIAAYLGDSFNVLMAAACGFPLVFLFAARRGDHRDVTYSIAITVLGFAWLGLGFSHAVLLRDLPDHGGALVIDVLIATFIGDTCAYGAGRLFGSRKLAPRISPNKTVEGLVGGFIGGTMAFWFAGLYQDWLPGLDALVMGMAIAAIAPIGDLFASMIKRDWEIKDTGKIFGPHGGLIDRLDAVLFTIVAGYYLSVAFVY
jgi:phosphatidate cytidylyltransferase